MSLDINTSTSQYEVVIGLETHIQLKTKTKMFCGCRMEYQSDEPNTDVCPRCLGLPGSLPLINKQAIKFGTLLGLALNCTIANETKFDRKNYSYPDLMKGYQISQYDEPLCYEGYIDLSTKHPKRVRIIRVHLEEDVAKLTHYPGFSQLDINRSGVPLLEVVTYPDMNSTEETMVYIEQLQQIIRYLEISTANMEDGSFRCDANISVRKVGSTKLGTKVEIKNMNRITAVGDAIRYECKRQIEYIRTGKKIVQETRGWNSETMQTTTQRSKEEALDYRYFPDPDLPAIKIFPDQIKEAAKGLPELPEAIKKRYINDYELSAYDVEILTSNRKNAEYFDEIISVARDKADDINFFAKQVANWLNGLMRRHLNEIEIKSYYDTKVTPLAFAELVQMFINKQVNNNTFKVILDKILLVGGLPEEIVKNLGLTKITDEKILASYVKKTIELNPKAVNDYHSGKVQALKFLLGQFMRLSKGRVEVDLASMLISKELSTINKEVCK